MVNNWAFLIWIGITAVLCSLTGGNREEQINGENQARTSMFWALMIFAPVIICAALRGNHEGDTGTYEYMFEQCPTAWDQAWDFIMNSDRDKGYAVCEFLFKHFIGDYFQLFIGIIAFFCGLIVVYVYRRYSCNYVISIFLFVAGFEYYQWMFNGMRQFMAVCIALSCTKDILAKQYKKIIIPFLIAASLHMSVLIVLPCLFFVQGKAFNRRTWLFVVGVMLVGLLLAQTGRLNDMIAKLMGSTQYDSVLDEFYETMDSGTNTLRVLVYLVPTLLALLGLRYIRQADDPLINFCTNMSVISSGIYVISMFTSAIMVGRLPIYFSIYNYILLPWEIEHMFEKRSAKLMTCLLVVFYLAYNYYQVALSYGQPFNLGFLSLR